MKEAGGGLETSKRPLSAAALVELISQKYSTSTESTGVDDIASLYKLLRGHRGVVRTVQRWHLAQSPPRTAAMSHLAMIPSCNPRLSSIPPGRLKFYARTSGELPLLLQRRPAAAAVSTAG